MALKWYRVYYRKDPDFMIDPNLTIEDIPNTHTLLLTIRAEDEEGAFGYMQGEVWSPQGQARELIEALQLKHTSMSVGDVVEDVRDGKFLQVAGMGWNVLHRKGA